MAVDGNSLKTMDHCLQELPPAKAGAGPMPQRVPRRLACAAESICKLRTGWGECKKPKPFAVMCLRHIKETEGSCGPYLDSRESAVVQRMTEKARARARGYGLTHQ